MAKATRTKKSVSSGSGRKVTDMALVGTSRSNAKAVPATPSTRGGAARGKKTATPISAAPKGSGRKVTDMALTGTDRASAKVVPATPSSGRTIGRVSRPRKKY